MPVLDARLLDSDVEGALMLGAILRPTRRSRERTRSRARQLLTTTVGDNRYAMEPQARPESDVVSTGLEQAGPVS